MGWTRFAHGLRRDPIVGAPEALVVLLPGSGDTAEALQPIAERWAPTVPTTAFVAFDLEPFDATGIDRAGAHLEPLLRQQLKANSLKIGGDVLVGFDWGGTLALHLVLRRNWRPAGVLAFAATLIRPFPRVLRPGRKIRLIESGAKDMLGRSELRDMVELLTKSGVDARGAVIPGEMRSDAALRHGGAYLMELVATAQLAERVTPDLEDSHAS